MANHSNSVFPGGACISQPRWMLARGILGSGRTGSVSSRPFPNSSGWWWLISSVFLIRISCHKTTPAYGYQRAWPGWAVSVSALPLTVPTPCLRSTDLPCSKLSKLGLGNITSYSNAVDIYAINLQLTNFENSYILMSQFFGFICRQIIELKNFG